MNILINFIKKIFIKNQTIPLGRWNLDKCINTINRKIDLSNNDHCGTCEYFLIINKNLVSKPNN